MPRYLRPARVLLGALAVLLMLMRPAAAVIEWEIVGGLEAGARPLDVAVSFDGKFVFVLTAGGEILIYGNDGTLSDKIAIGPQAERLAVDPEGDKLYVTNRNTKRVDVVLIDTIQTINTDGAPFKGRADAPVTIAVFSDFQ
jgi:DNA-binding beta-propeller fold protein YncE